MKIIFRGLVVFEYFPYTVSREVITRMNYLEVPNFNQCCFTTEDYKLLSQYFDTVARHRQGEDVELKDISVS